MMKNEDHNYSDFQLAEMFRTFANFLDESFDAELMDGPDISFPFEELDIHAMLNELVMHSDDIAQMSITLNR